MDMDYGFTSSSDASCRCRPVMVVERKKSKRKAKVSEGVRVAPLQQIERTDKMDEFEGNILMNDICLSS